MVNEHTMLLPLAVVATTAPAAPTALAVFCARSSQRIVGVALVDTQLLKYNPLEAEIPNNLGDI